LIMNTVLLVFIINDITLLFNINTTYNKPNTYYLHFLKCFNIIQQIPIRVLESFGD